MATISRRLTDDFGGLRLWRTDGPQLDVPSGVYSIHTFLQALFDYANSATGKVCVILALRCTRNSDSLRLDLAKKLHSFWIA
ncbi:hypothetical protein L596_027954 [Steinernema carpocapsae]|uniref:Uncharacterized protein n=1 Tax=Steinernema carpocapsae TaxID=34508 RepID=A0A4U5LX07_STECR|nr:hypothetical protein L596_027954 [Steinernema carpocapsae]